LTETDRLYILDSTPRPSALTIWQL